MNRSGNARVGRRAAPHEPVPASESGVRRRTVLGEEVGAIHELLGPPEQGLHWLLTQPARCANDAARFSMTIDAQGILLRCPRCAHVAQWTAADDKGPDALLGP